MKKALIATICEATNVALSNLLTEYEVHTCSTATTALRLLETLRPHVLVLDLMLSEMDGITVLKKSNFRPPIILARTNLISRTVLQAAADVGVQDVLIIPCTPRYLADRLNKLTEEVPAPEI